MTSPLLVLAWLAGIFYVGGTDPLMLLIAFALPLFLLSGKLAMGRAGQWHYSPADALMGLMSLWLVAVVFWSALPALAVEVAMGLGMLPLMYFLTRLQLTSGEGIRSVLAATWPAIFLMLAIAIPEFWIIRSRVTSTMEDANAFAGLLNAVFFPTYFICLWRLTHSKPSRPWTLPLALLTLLFTLAATTSMSGQLCFAVGLGAAAVVMRRQPALALKAAFVTAVVLGTFYVMVNTIYSDRNTLSRLGNLGQESGFIERVAMTQSALKIYERHPLLGNGFGAYKMLYPQYRSPLDRSTSGDLAHNDYVQFLMEGGPVLLLCLLGCALLCGWRLWQNIWRGWPDPTPPSAQDAENAALQKGALIGVCCLFLQAAMNFIFYALPLAMLAGTLLAVVEHPLSSTTSPRQNVSSSIAKPLAIISSLLLVLVTVALLSRILFSAITLETCNLQLCRKARDQARLQIPLANFLVATQPSWPTARFYLASTFTSNAGLATDPAVKAEMSRLAAKDLLAFVRMAPDMDISYVLLADLAQAYPAVVETYPAGLPRTPEGLMQMAINRRPQNQPLRLQLGQRLLAQGKDAEAFEVVHEGTVIWWKDLSFTDEERIAALRFTLPLAAKLGRCSAVTEQAAKLLTLAPADELAQRAGQAAQPVSENPVGCGFAPPLTANPL